MSQNKSVLNWAKCVSYSVTQVKTQLHENNYKVLLKMLILMSWYVDFESERLKFIYIVRTSVKVEIMNLQSRECFGKQNTSVFLNQHNGTRYCYAECRYAEYHYAKCRYAECRFCSVSKISQLC